jgi:hypothetical protein
MAVMIPVYVWILLLLSRNHENLMASFVNYVRNLQQLFYVLGLGFWPYSKVVIYPSC